MRKGFNGLCGLVETAAGAQAPLDVTAGGLFVFINRARDRIKVLDFDRDGWTIWYEALEQGRFELPAASDRVALDATQLRLILDGIDLSSVKRRKRYALSRMTFAQLQAENDALRAEMAAWRSQAESERERLDLERLRADREAYRADLAVETAQDVQARLAWLEHKLFSRQSERFVDPNQQELVFTSDGENEASADHADAPQAARPPNA